MTYIDDVLILANQLANADKKPTVALIKAKLNVQVPLPVIINTLKIWVHDPNFVSLIKSNTETQKLNPKIEYDTQLLSLIEKIVATELSQVKIELELLKKQVEMLSNRNV